MGRILGEARTVHKKNLQIETVMVLMHFMAHVCRKFMNISLVLAHSEVEPGPGTRLAHQMRRSPKYVYFFGALEANSS